MAEYIDKKYLDRKFQIDMMCIRGGTLFDTEKIINSLPVADVIEREKINKAIEEIQKLRGCSCSCSDGIIDDVEDVLDKLIEERGE